MPTDQYHVTDERAELGLFLEVLPVDPARPENLLDTCLIQGIEPGA